ncbi:ABC transporter ATP-binding protein [Ancrocorticia sp.]|uniref:ABC transporter ATP-binding protein n=1 Tax=Ancrocorticia sp. TaxID=2593684 RepID=UPI003F8E5A07
MGMGASQTHKGNKIGTEAGASTSPTRSPRVIGALWKLLATRQKVILILVSIGNTGAAVSVVLPSVIIGDIVSKLTIDPAASIVGDIALLCSLLALFVILKVAVHISLHSVLPRIEADLREAQLERALKTPVETGGGDSQYAAELNSLMGKGAKAGGDSVKIAFNDLMPAVMQAVVAAITAFSSRWEIGLILLLSGIVSMSLTQFQLSNQGGVRLRINKAKSRLDGVMTELLRGKPVIRTLNAADAESHRVGRRALELSSVEVRHHKVMGLFDAAKTSSESIFSVVVLIVAAGFVASGANPGSVLTLYLLFTQFATPLQDIHRIRDELNESNLQLYEVFRILRQPLDQLFTRSASRDKVTGADVDFDGVSVTYGDGTRAVRNVSLRVPEGSFLGICGPAGCGKSTLIKALVGILPVSGGKITVGGVAISDMNADQLASTIAYVSQDPYTVSGTVRANLRLGQSADITDERLTGMLETVGLFDELKDGLETTVGEDGDGLSGGQKQRLVLARILLRPAEVIVLDEATSALDNLNEEHFMKALLSSGRTVISIAHRLSTLRKADEIVVMKDGHIDQEGTFSSLDERAGLFHELLHAGELT